MKHKKTVKGFISLLHCVEGHCITSLNGFEHLTIEEQKALSEVCGFIGNILGDDLERFDKMYLHR